MECNGLVGLLEMYRVHDLEILEEDGFVMFVLGGNTQFSCRDLEKCVLTGLCSSSMAYLTWLCVQ